MREGEEERWKGEKWNRQRQREMGREEEIGREGECGRKTEGKWCENARGRLKYWHFTD